MNHPLHVFSLIQVIVVQYCHGQGNASLRNEIYLRITLKDPPYQELWFVGWAALCSQ